MSNMEPPQSSYIGRHAELYDLFYGDKPYQEEAEFVHECLQKYSTFPARKILELACGTGTHSLLFEKMDYKVVATDYSEGMLTQARKKSEAVHSQVIFRLQDMKTLDVPERPFDAIICLFDSIGYVATNENIRKVFDNVRLHLRDGGLFIFEFWHAGAMIRDYDPLRIRRWTVPNGEILRISETTINYTTQLCEVSYSIYELNKDGSYNSLKETQINRFFLMQEMDYFLHESGFTPLKWFAGFRDEPVEEATWHIVVVASTGSRIEK